MKYTIQEARTILGVNQNSSKDDIEKKYDIVLKKYRIAKSNGTLDEKAEADYEKSTEAYRIVMGYEVDEPGVEKKDTYADKAFEKVGIDKKKANNFFDYHKYHILISILAIIIIVFTVKAYVTKVDPDIIVGFIGEVNTEGFDSLQNKIKEKVPEIKKVGFDSATLTNNYTDPTEYANLSKAMILLTSSSDIDLFLLSKYSYDKYANSGPFMPLEGISKELDIDVSKSEYLKLRVVDEWEDAKVGEANKKVLKYRDSEPKLYGIDVTNSEFFKGINCMGPEKILVIKSKIKNRDLVLKLVKLFTE